jgi:hypothetical protein
MKFSLLCPTRARIKEVERLLRNLQETATNLGQIEILFVIDEDDGPTIQFFNIISHQHLYENLNLSHYLRMRSDFTNRDYYNWLADKAKGDYLWAIADDVIFLIKDWDTIITKRIEDYLQDKPDRIMCAGIKDSTPLPKRELPNFPCFPLVTREAYKFFDFLLHPQIPTWGADFLLYSLYHGANRYLPINDSVYLDHISWHTKQATEDATAKNIRAIFGKMQHNPVHNVDYNLRNTIPQQIDKLKTHLQRLSQGNA